MPSCATLLPLAQAEAQAAFADDAVYLERFLDRPRHIEIQLLGDGKGAVVHLGERDCSLQRSASEGSGGDALPGLDEAARREITEIAVKALEKLGYQSAGTIEFLYQDGEFSFIEMNTRLQVEHPITEMVSGIDLVREQLRIAAGAPLGYRPVRYPSARPCDRVPDQCRARRRFPPLAGADQRVPRAGRARRPRR